MHYVKWAINVGLVAGLDIPAG